MAETQESTGSASKLVCSIALMYHDRIWLVEVPRGLFSGVGQAIREGWHKGIKKERDGSGAYEFELYGKPWRDEGGDESLWSRGLITSLLMFMARNGWSLLQSVDLSKNTHEAHTLFFEQAPPDPDVQIFAVSFNCSDRIRVIGAPGIMPIVKSTVCNHWKKGIDKATEYGGAAAELKLRGNPWYQRWHTDGEDPLSARILLNHILADIRAVGFKLYASIDINTRGHDIDSWFFRKVGTAFS